MCNVEQDFACIVLRNCCRMITSWLIWLVYPFPVEEYLLPVFSLVCEHAMGSVWKVQVAMMSTVATVFNKWATRPSTCESAHQYVKILVSICLSVRVWSKFSSLIWNYATMCSKTFICCGESHMYALGVSLGAGPPVCHSSGFILPCLPLFLNSSLNMAWNYANCSDIFRNAWKGSQRAENGL